jgi:hypothetical protein
MWGSSFKVIPEEVLSSILRFPGGRGGCGVHSQQTITMQNILKSSDSNVLSTFIGVQTVQKRIPYRVFQWKFGSSMALTLTRKRSPASRMWGQMLFKLSSSTQIGWRTSREGKLWEMRMRVRGSHMRLQ